MKLPLGFFQLLLILAWYVVPAMATVPWFIIFAPTLLSLVILGVVLLMLLVVVIVKALTN